MNKFDLGIRIFPHPFTNQRVWTFPDCVLFWQAVTNGFWMSEGERLPLIHVPDWFLFGYYPRWMGEVKV